MTSSMYNSIQHFNEIGVRKIEKVVKNFTTKEKKDLADLVFELQEILFELGRNILQEVLEDMDQYLRDCEIRKNSWEIIRSDQTSILTSFGTIRYNRTYFKPKNGGKRTYLVDEIVGIKPHDRVSADVVINAIEEATESSYRKGGECAAYLDDISKQAVMNKIHALEIPKQEVNVTEKKRERILYIEADEDHVPLQQKKGKKENGHNVIMPRLVYVHEGYSEESTEERKILRNPRYFGGVYDNIEDLWLEVADYIDKQYDVDYIETIYISGDGAAWIKQGLNWIVKSKFVLDSYHLKKYIKKATAHLEDETLVEELIDALEEPNKDALKKVLKKIIDITESETKIKEIKEARKYMLNNWKGIEIKADNSFEIVGCSAEGHVSHIFSDRLSSRPKGWSKKGVAQISKLRIFKKNGGNVYDLVMAQKQKEAINRQREINDEIIRELRASQKYDYSWNSELTVIKKGHKNGLYNELRKIIGICG